MPLPNKIGAYADCYELWEAAAQRLPKGGCRSFVGSDRAQADYLRARLHQHRSLLRDEARRTYPKDHPLWNRSPYDHLKVTIVQDTDADYWIYIEPHGNWNAVAQIEDIPVDERIAAPPPTVTIAPNPQLSYKPKAIPNAEQDDLE